MNASDYAGAVEAWKIKLAINLARRMGFKRHDLEDAVQELAIASLKFQYDPQRAQGLCEEQSLAGLFERRLKDLRRKAGRARRGLEDTHVEDRPDHKDRDPDRDVDVRLALARLGKRERAICEALSNGRTVQEIAESLGCGWATLARQIALLREHLQSHGLENYLPPIRPSSDVASGGIDKGVLGSISPVNNLDCFVDAEAPPATEDDFLRRARPA